MHYVVGAVLSFLGLAFFLMIGLGLIKQACENSAKCPEEARTLLGVGKFVYDASEKADDAIGDVVEDVWGEDSDTPSVIDHTVEVRDVTFSVSGGARANVRTCASVNCQAHWSLGAFQSLSLIRTEEGDSVNGEKVWYKIAAQGVEGYIHCSRFLITNWYSDGSTERVMSC